MTNFTKTKKLQELQDLVPFFRYYILIMIMKMKTKQCRLTKIPVEAQLVKIGA